MNNVAILHDRFPTIGGGEKVAIEAARVLDAPIYTTYVNNLDEFPDDVTVFPFQQEKYTTLPWRLFLTWKSEGMNPLESLNVALDMTDADARLAEYDVIVSSGPLSKSYVPTVDQQIVHYPHSPPRWLYDLYRDRLQGFQQPIIGSLVKLYAKAWRSLDQESNNYVDLFVANSELIRKRIRRYYDRDAEVLYPPVSGRWRDTGDDGYFITWSRLTPEKRVALIAEAFSELDERLIIAGDGPERSKVESIAKKNDNIEVRGYVDDIEELVSRATGVVYAPKQEDFGLVAAEAMTAGKPVLGVNEGYTRYQITEGVTGALFEPSVNSIRDTIREFDSSQFDSKKIREHATRYSYEKFESGLERLVKNAQSES